MHYAAVLRMLFITGAAELVISAATFSSLDLDWIKIKLNASLRNE